MADNVVVKDTEEKEKRTTKQKVFLGLRIVGNIIFYSILVLLMMFSIMNANGGNGKKNFPNIAGKGFLVVESNSMTRQKNNKSLWPDRFKKYDIGSFSNKDMVIDEVISGKSDCKKLKIGDVITFYDVNLDGLNTHRIVEIVYSGGELQGFVTQGDLLASEGEGTAYYSEEEYLAISSAYTHEKYAQYVYGLESGKKIENVTIENVKGKVVDVWYGWGDGMRFVTSEKGWLMCFILPIGLLLILELFLVVRNVMALKKENAAEKNAALNEENKAKEKIAMQKELLAEMVSQGLMTQEQADARIAALEAELAPKKEEIEAPVEVAQEEVIEAAEQPVEVAQEDTTNEVAEQPVEVVAEAPVDAPVEEATDAPSTQEENTQEKTEEETSDK